MVKNSDNQTEKVLRFIQIQKNLKLKQKDFAERLGLTQSKVSLINNGKAGNNILNEIFYRLHYEFGISKDWWETGKGEMFVEIINKYQPIQEESIRTSIDWEENYKNLKNKYVQLLEEYNHLLKLKLKEATEVRSK